MIGNLITYLVIFFVCCSVFLLGTLVAQLFEITPTWPAGIAAIAIFIRFYPQIRSLFL